MIDRRLLVGAGALAALVGSAACASSGSDDRYGSVGRIKATPGQRKALAEAIMGGGDMPGCLAYYVAEDLGDADTLWVFEVWRDKAAHDASLSLPAVRAAIARARPLIAGFEPGADLRLVGERTSTDGF